VPCLQHWFRRCASFAFLSAFPRGKPPGPLALPTILPDLGTGRRIRSPPAGATQTPGTTSMPHACHIFPAKHPNRFSCESFRRQDKTLPFGGQNVPETGHNRATFRTESANPHQIVNGIPAGTDNAETRTHPGFWQLAPNQVLHPFCHPPLDFWVAARILETRAIKEGRSGVGDGISRNAPSTPRICSTKFGFCSEWPSIPSADFRTGVPDKQATTSHPW